MRIGITCLEHSLGLVTCIVAKTMVSLLRLESPDSNPRGLRYSDSCRVGLIESKPSNCEAPDASIGAFLYVVSMEIFSAERAWYEYRAI
jgi:hypothetical protein